MKRHSSIATEQQTDDSFERECDELRAQMSRRVPALRRIALACRDKACNRAGDCRRTQADCPRRIERHDPASIAELRAGLLRRLAELEK